jgi:hypothetical protein
MKIDFAKKPIIFLHKICLEAFTIKASAALPLLTYASFILCSYYFNNFIDLDILFEIENS